MACSVVKVVQVCKLQISRDVFHNRVNVLNPFELSTGNWLRWYTLCYMKDPV